MADRSEYTDTYQVPGGGYETKVSATPINYALSAQSWAPINNTLTTDATTGFAAENTANSYKAEFPTTLASPVRVGTSAAWVTLSLVGAGGTLSESGDTATYTNALPGVTVTYAAEADQVKESLILASAAAPSSFVYHLAVSPGASLTQDGNNVDLVAGGATVATIPASTVADASGATGAVTSALAADPNGGWDFTVTVASAWLADASRVFPVTVDPSLWLETPTFCEIDSYTPTTSNCTSTGSLSVGTVSHSSTLYKQRDLVQFVLGSNIPYDALVTNAQMGSASSSSTENILVQPVSTAWNSTATWNQAESGSSWTGGSTVPGYTAAGYTSSYSNGGYLWSVTGAVQDWVTEHSYPTHTGTTNNGFLMQSTNETANNNISISLPSLFIYWQYRMGDQAGLSYDKTAIDDQASLGVAAANGNGKLTTNDLNLPGIGNNLSVSHTYNSWAAGDGSGWSFSVGHDVQALLYPDHSVVLYDGTGNAQVFTEQPTAVTQPCVVNGTSYTTDLSPPLDTNDCAHGINEFTSTGKIFLVDNNTQTSYTFGGTANASNAFPIIDDSEYAYYLTAITDRNGNSITFSYNSSNQLTSMTDTEGRTFTVTPDSSNGEPATIAGPTGATGANYRTWTYAWSTSNPAQLDHYIDPAGKYTRYYYDSNGNLDEILAPGTAAGTTETDLDIGTLGETRGVTLDDSSCPSGACTTTYDTARVPQPSPSNPACTSYEGSGESSPTLPTTMVGCATVTDPNGNVTSYGYSVLDSVVKTVDAKHHVSLNTYTTTHNQPNSSTDALGNNSSATYDLTSQNLATSTDPITGTGQTAAMSVNAYKTSTTLVNGGAFLPSSATDPSGDCTYYGYDTNGNKKDTWTGLTATGTGSGQYCSSPTSPPTGAAHTIDVYKGDSGTSGCNGQPGQLCSQTSPNGNTTTYGYDGVGQLTTVTPPSPLGATTYTYDANGRVLTSTDGAGRTTAYTYDADNRVLTVNYNASGDPTCANPATCITYTYDANGNRTSMLDNTGTTTWSYNQRNAMTAEYLPGAASRTCGESPTGPDNITQVTDTGIHYGYDADGNLTGYCDAGGTISYAYDAVNNLTGVADPGGNCTAGSIVQPCTQYGYNNANQKTSITYPTVMGASEAITPDGAGHVKQFTVTEAGSTVISRTYSYADPVTGTIDRGRLGSVDDTVAHVTTAYSYTHTPYLTCAQQTNDPGHTTPGLTLLTYGYDLDGNMTSTTSGRSSCGSASGGTTSNYSYNNADQSTTGSAAFDNAGNQTETQSGINLTYNPLTQTTAIGSSDPLTYTGGGQDGLNGDTTATTLQNSSVLGVTAVTTSGSTVYFTRDPNGNLVTMRVGAANYSYVLDSAKTVIALLAASGTSPAATYTYDPYGKQLTTLTGVGATNPFQYNSGYQTASGDIHFGARYYDPNIGRWTQLDPSGKNAGYVFADNNPTNQSDQSGREGGCFIRSTCGESQGGTSIPYESILHGAECTVSHLEPGDDDADLIEDGLGAIGGGVGTQLLAFGEAGPFGAVALPTTVSETAAGGYLVYQGSEEIASQC